MSSSVPCHECYYGAPPNPPTYVPIVVPGFALEFTLLGCSSLLALLQNPEEGKYERQGGKHYPDGEVQTLQGGCFQTDIVAEDQMSCCSVD